MTASDNLQQVISTVAAAEYGTSTRRLAEVEGDQRTELLNTWLLGSL